jgi:hypothetical protein
VFLFTKPPVIRWFAAALAIAVSMWLDIRPPATEQHPFAVADLAAGTVVDAATVQMRDVPRGMLTRVQLPSVLGHAVRGGDPITASAIVQEPAIPPGSSILELGVPNGTEVGDTVTAVIIGSDPGGDPETVDGIVVGLEERDSAPPKALCAFARDSAARLAAADAEGRVTVLRSG